MTRDRKGGDEHVDPRADGSDAGSDHRRDERHGGSSDRERNGKGETSDVVRLLFGSRDARSESILRGELFDRALPAEEETHLIGLLASLRGDDVAPEAELRERIRKSVARKGAAEGGGASRPRPGPGGRRPDLWTWIRRPVPAWAVALGVLVGLFAARGVPVRRSAEVERPPVRARSSVTPPFSPGFVVAESYETAVAALPAGDHGAERVRPRALASDSL